ncbi:MAG: GAF domain-containing protein [Nitrospinaceae bacterium]|nr:GAF domain-containing protein [Nitrospinaceae bacterium]NIR54943.1 GAF domain-containing protein [Nitrospinaceae bacterium]NIT82185.1 GAF domain-containing protein [Nitrospinaceae bacterium]NIX34572.1 GAF domain-containing protein [Nitrospinaceae bacterium]NIY15398.1 GAF domain-containing protein [Nitrospinaceae bacterium]
MIPAFSKLTQTLNSYNKENLSEILHLMATTLKNNYDCHSVRIYLEDLYEGMLICHYVTGQNQPDQHRITKYISPRESITSKAFYENSVVVSWNVPGGISSFRNPFEAISGIQSTAVFPITYQMRPIGTLSLDWNEEGEFLSPSAIETITQFLGENSAVIEKAKRYHQNIAFSRHLDAARKKDSAWLMMRSSVNLIEKLTLASVLIPASQNPPPKSNGSPSDLVEILAVFSQNIEHAGIYNNRDQISVLEGHHLINRIIEFEPSRGLIMKDSQQESIYHANIMDEQFPRKEIASKANLVSLYQVPKYDRQTGKFICAIHYYTSEPYEFTVFEKDLLEHHAAMVENLILEESPTHIEVQVLSEIEELLSDESTSLQSFLHHILSKTSELLDADCGTISLLKIVDGKPWLVVEDKEGRLVGAKSRGWKKNKIPHLPVGGSDLPDDQKSVNGYCAHTARPVLFSDVRNPKITQNYYQNLSSAIRSELAVPIIYENKVLGVINQDSFKVGHFKEEHKKILQIVSRLIGQKVHHLKQIEEVRREMSVLREEIEYRDPKVSSYYLGNVIGKSRKIHHLVKQIDTVVESISHRMLNWDSGQQIESAMGLPSLLITGQTGTGKEFFFNNIYSRLLEIFRKSRGNHYELPLRKTNIAAYSGDLTYSELFGHRKGAFTSADSHRKGILEETNGGIVFLDEIGDADPKTQVQLLRFLDTGAFMRLGESQPRYSQIFLIAATNKNLLKEIEAGRFREDLYHRLNAISFHIPPLSERKEDIEDLAIHFLGRLHSTYKKDSQEKPPHLDQSAIDFLTQCNYRGNVRELKNLLLRTLLFCKNSVITGEDLSNAGGKETPEPEAWVQDANWESKILEQVEQGQGDFWTSVYQPFKSKRLTRDAVSSLIQAAKNRYQTNLPGLAVKLGVCDSQFRDNSEENKKFLSFKNFLYKTVKITGD